MGEMEIYLHKLLPVLFLPTGLLFLLMLAGLLLRSRTALVAALAFFWLSAMPAVSDTLMRVAENHAERIAVDDAPSAAAIVVLSEGRIVAPGEMAISEWSDGDRFWGGIELYQAGKAPLLIFTGGWVPWIPDAAPDGEVMMRYAERLGVPAGAMRTTGKVMNTDEEARAVAALLEPGTRILLVTSAFHMPRSLRLFADAGLQPTGYPVDFEVNAAKRLGVIDFVPTANAFRRTEQAWRELLGRAYYALRRA